MAKIIKKIFNINRNLCSRLAFFFPQAQEKSLFDLYEEIVSKYMNEKQNQIIVDIGGGKTCYFAKYRDPFKRNKIIGIDISKEELSYNNDVDEKIVADATKKLPFIDEAVDIVASKCVIEHLKNTEDFISESCRILKRGGYSIHLIPAKFAPFAFINQMLPQKISAKLLFFFRPDTRGVCGFPAYYNKCYWSAINSLFKKNGFEIAESHFGYYQSTYFNFFVPLFLASASYEIIVRSLGIKNLCAYILIVAKKK